MEHMRVLHAASDWPHNFGSIEFPNVEIVPPFLGGTIALSTIDEVWPDRSAHEVIWLHSDHMICQVSEANLYPPMGVSWIGTGRGK